MIRALLTCVAASFVAVGVSAYGCDDDGEIQTFDVAPVMTIAGGYSAAPCGGAAVVAVPSQTVVVQREVPVVVGSAPAVYGGSIGRGFGVNRGVAVGRGIGYSSVGGVGGGSIQAGRAVRLRNNVINGAAPFQIQGGRRVKLKNNVFN